MQTISHGKIIIFLSFCLLKVQVTKKRNYITVTFVIVKIVTFVQVFLKGF